MEHREPADKHQPGQRPETGAFSRSGRVGAAWGVGDHADPFAVGLLGRSYWSIRIALAFI